LQARALAHLANTGLSKGLLGWCDYAAWAAKQRRALGALGRRRERAALNGWLYWLANAAAQRAR